MRLLKYRKEFRVRKMETEGPELPHTDRSVVLLIPFALIINTIQLAEEIVE